MRNTGTISLYNVDEKLNISREYFTIAQRRKLFQKFWDEEIPGSYIQISLDPVRPKIIGITPNVKREPIERPPAKYDNRTNCYDY
jgi:hypothetical protein